MTARSSSMTDIAKNSAWSRLYVGLVIDNEDPDMLQRVRVVIPGLMEAEHKDKLPWIAPMQTSPFGIGDNFGSLHVPYLGSRVIVEFQEKDLSRGLYLSSVVTSKTTLPDELLGNYPHRDGWASPKGDLFYRDSQTGQHFFRHSSGSGFTIEPDGSFNFVCVGNRTDVVRGDYALSVEGDFSVIVAGDHSMSVGDNRSLTVSGNETHTVAGTADLSVSGNRSITCAQEARSGPIYSTDDVVADGISLINHPHGGVQSGSSLTDPPS